MGIREHESSTVAAILNEVMECNYLRGCQTTKYQTSQKQVNMPLRVVSIRGEIPKVDFANTENANRRLNREAYQTHRACVITVEDAWAGLTWTLALTHEGPASAMFHHAHHVANAFTRDDINLLTNLRPLNQELRDCREAFIETWEHTTAERYGLDREGRRNCLSHWHNQWSVRVSNSAGFHSGPFDFVRAIRYFLVPHLSEQRVRDIEQGTWFYTCSLERAYFNRDN